MVTLETIQKVLSDNLDIEPETVTVDATLEGLGVDSLDMAELICSLEEELEIDFGEPEDIETIGQLVEYIEAL